MQRVDEDTSAFVMVWFEKYGEEIVRTRELLTLPALPQAYDKAMLHRAPWTGRHFGAWVRGHRWFRTEDGQRWGVEGHGEQMWRLWKAPVEKSD